MRTFVETELIHQAIVPVKGKAGTAAELLDRFLPDGLASWQTTIDKNITTDTPAPGLRFHLRGSAAPNCLPPDASGNVECSITFSEVGLGFYAPNNARPLINNDYAIGDPTIAALGAVETFDTHLVHQNTLGTSSLTGTVAIALMGGGQDPTARVQVVGSVVVPVQRPVINEVVVEPQRDWNDSGAGGNGVPFDDTPGTSVAPSPAVTAGDQWIELLTVTGSPAELTNWTLEFTTTAGVADRGDAGAGEPDDLGGFAVRARGRARRRRASTASSGCATPPTPSSTRSISAPFRQWWATRPA